MTGNLVYGSLTRISDLQEVDYRVSPLARNHWESTDYVMAQVVSPPGPYSRMELSNGRLVRVLAGDRIVGALGKRAATLEATGDWSLLRDGELLDLLTPAGLLARETSHSPAFAAFPVLKYLGHLFRGEQKLRMKNFAIKGSEESFNLPTVMLVGTSMSAGKTTVGKIVVRQLKAAGLKVVGAKLAGAGRYRDVLSFGDAGADHIFDFVDMGMPSSICPQDEYRLALQPLLSHIAKLSADVLVAEVGASPLEPYNGATAIDALGDCIDFTILCASDPYAVVGITTAFERQPDLVTGPCANTLAGQSLIKKLTGLPTMNSLQAQAGDLVREMLEQHLRGLRGRPSSRSQSLN